MSAFKLQQLTTAFFSCHSFIRLFFFNFQTNKVFGSGESSTWPVISTATPYLALALTDALFASFLAWKATFSQDCFQFSLDSLNIAQWDDVYSRGWKILHLLFQFTVILYFMLAGKTKCQKIEGFKYFCRSLYCTSIHRDELYPKETYWRM